MNYWLSSEKKNATFKHFALVSNGHERWVLVYTYAWNDDEDKKRGSHIELDHLTESLGLRK